MGQKLQMTANTAILLEIRGILNQHSKEPENDKSVQQPSVIRGSFTQIMVNPMQLQDHELTAWLDRLVEARKN